MRVFPDLRLHAIGDLLKSAADEFENGYLRTSFTLVRSGLEITAYLSCLEDELDCFRSHLEGAPLEIIEAENLLNEMDAVVSRRLSEENALDRRYRRLRIGREVCDQIGFQGKVVGEERNAFAGFLVPHHDAAQGGRIVLARVEHRDHTGLVAQHIGVDAIDRVRVAPLELGVALGADSEDSLRLIDGEQAPEVQISAIEQVVGARLDNQVVQNVDLVGLAIGNVNECWTAQPGLQ